MNGDLAPSYIILHNYIMNIQYTIAFSSPIPHTVAKPHAPLCQRKEGGGGGEEERMRESARSEKRGGGGGVIWG